MKRIFTLAAQAVAAGFVLALVLSSTALAQTAQPWTFGAPACRPAELGGPGARLLTRDEPNVGSCYVGWWCPPASTGPWKWYGHCVLDRYKYPFVYQAFARALATRDVELIWSQFSAAVSVQPKDAAEQAVFNGLHIRFYQQALAERPPDVAPPPPPVRWVVDAATSADGTRPAYAFANGVRAAASTARAQAGQPCRPEVAQASSGISSKVFAAYGPAFSPSLVALCRVP